MREKTAEKKGRKTGLFILLCVAAFVVSFAGAIAFKASYTAPEMRQYTVKWTDDMGTIHTDLSYGNKPANKFDLYLPADSSKASYGLVVYLHPGGFTSGDKADDRETLKWLCSKGYVAAGINYTLFTEENPEANVYTQSMEIRESMPHVIAAAAELGYPINEMAIAGGSAGHCLAMLYAYRDADDAPVPVKLVFGAVGPSSFYPEDWGNYGLDQEGDDVKAAAAGLFGVMAGKEIDPSLFGTPAYDEAVKDISALLWVDENSVPSLMAYGAHDTVQPYLASVRLDAALTKYGVPHDYIVLEHSGHGLQNDDKESALYMQKILEYLDTYMPI